jgi:hypothetical protein
MKCEKEFMELKVQDNCSNERASDVYIYNDLPVMCVKNNKVLKTINSEEFIVESFSETEIILKNADEPDFENITVDIKNFHNNFVANYAATCHKSQGATITKNIVLFDWTRMLDDTRIGYTAVSRGRKCEQIRICREIDMNII